MFERFTERARTVVVHAQETARESGHGYIGTEHILVGLTHEEEAIASKVLAYLGVDHDVALKAMHEIVPPTGEEITGGPLPLTPRCKKVLELALREALSLGHNYIGTEHILLGLVRENEGVAARILLDRNIDSEMVRNEVIRQINGTKHKATPVTALAPEAKPPATMPVFTIKAQDVLSQPVVTAYLKLCEQLGLFEQAREVTAALNEIRRWQDANRDKVKIPDHKHVDADHQGELAA